MSNHLYVLFLKIDFKGYYRYLSKLLEYTQKIDLQVEHIFFPTHALIYHISSCTVADISGLNLEHNPLKKGLQ